MSLVVCKYVSLIYAISPLQLDPAPHTDVANRPVASAQLHAAPLRLLCESRQSKRGASQAFDRGQADVLLGTQMIAKGLDFPKVTLVGVIDADVGLNLPDFRAGERTFQLLTQVHQVWVISSFRVLIFVLM